MAYQAWIHGFRIGEVPIHFRNRRREASKLTTDRDRHGLRQLRAPGLSLRLPAPPPPPGDAVSSGRPTRLDAERIQKTIDHLSLRVEARFPDSGLARVSRDLGLIAAETKERVAWISRPILGLRVAVAFLILLISAVVFFAITAVRTPNEPLKLVEFTQGVESGINDVILVGAGIFFLVTAERRIKRRRALAAINELRAMAHLIDMHQLTKDPEWVLGRGEQTAVLAAARDEPLRAEPLPRLLQRDALAHEQGRGALRRRTSTTRWRSRRSTRSRT